MNLTKKIFNILRYYGVPFCVFRCKYTILKKTGFLQRRFPQRPWSKLTLSDFAKHEIDDKPATFLKKHCNNATHFFFDRGNPPCPNKTYEMEIISEVENILNNRFRYFFNNYYDLGQDPDWFVNPSTGKHIENNRHWCRIDELNDEVGDIKFIWEPSRFAWSYLLIRAYAAEKNEKYVEKFWTLFESWLAANQPNSGPNYCCGQECAIRLMAMCFAMYAFWSAENSTDERLIKLILAISVHADRIAKNINYAVSTKTNHSLTEAAGLYTAGTLFPELKLSEYWRKLGKRILIQEA